MGKKVTVVGSYNVGLFLKGPRFPEVGETLVADKFFEGPGGKGSNQAIAASKFGAETTFVGCIGEDKYGKDALAMYESMGISTEAIRIDPTIHSGISVIFIDEDGRNMIEIVLGANGRLSNEDIDNAEKIIKDSAIVGFQLEGSIELVDYGIRKVHSMGVKTLLDPAPAVKLDESLYPFIDYIKPNETEANILTGIDVVDKGAAEKAGEWFLGRGVKTAIITMGEKGTLMMSDGVNEFFPALDVEAADTTGAGDIFSGALMAALADGKKIAEAIIYANHAAAISVTRLGVIDAIPEVEEVEKFIAENNR
jgi:ribokinase